MVDPFAEFRPDAVARFTCWSQYQNGRYSNVGDVLHASNQRVNPQLDLNSISSALSAGSSSNDDEGFINSIVRSFRILSAAISNSHMTFSVFLPPSPLTIYSCLSVTLLHTPSEPNAHFHRQCPYTSRPPLWVGASTTLRPPLGCGYRFKSTSCSIHSSTCAYL